MASILILGAFAYVIWNKKTAYIELYRTNHELKDQSSSINTLKRDLEETATEREALKKRIIADEAVIDFLALIEAIGSEQQVELTTNSLSVQPLTGPFETLVVRMEVKGDYEAIMHILTLMEQLPYQSVVTSVQMSAYEEGEWTATYEVQVTKYKKI